MHVSSMDRQPKVSYGQMNHENLEKVTSNKAQVKTVTYLGASIFPHRRRPKPFGWLNVSPNKNVDLGSLSEALKSFK
jgi:hypothetical protein